MSCNVRGKKDLVLLGSSETLWLWGSSRKVPWIIYWSCIRWFQLIPELIPTVSTTREEPFSLLLQILPVGWIVLIILFLYLQQTHSNSPANVTSVVKQWSQFEGTSTRGPQRPSYTAVLKSPSNIAHLRATTADYVADLCHKLLYYLVMVKNIFIWKFWTNKYFGW